MKFIFVTWWVVSWLWKWISAASIWRLMKSCWYSVNMVKMDPYLQVDAWTMSPYEHWEVFVTDDWAETDLDIWHYERFIDENLTWDSSITSWKIYREVINKERKWDYLWKTVQVIPHITDEIKNRLKKIWKKVDITIVEVWWTIWDIEAPHFIEAIRQMKKDIWSQNVIYVHVAPLLYLQASWEVKTKPIQHSVKELRWAWIQADILICRSEVKISKNIKEKIWILCDVDYDSVIEAVNAKSIYEVPVTFKKQNLDLIIQHKLNISPRSSDLDLWQNAVNNITKSKNILNIWIAWKYAEYKDAYLSLIEALYHAWANNNVRVNIHWIQTDNFEWIDFESKVEKIINELSINWIIIPWWFWWRWIQWKLNFIKYVREKNIPFLWLCLWLQSAVIEYARNVCKITNANSREFDENCNEPVIDFLPEQKNIKNKWWTMRLWSYQAILSKDSIVYKLYWENKINERHRHRYEVNPDYHKILNENWLIISWLSPDKKLVEFIELPNNRFFVATQAHPEFKSRLDKPHPLFDWLIKACIK